MARRSYLIALTKKNSMTHKFYELLLRHITKDTCIDPDHPVQLTDDMQSKALQASATACSQNWHYNELIQYLCESTQQPWQAFEDNPYGEDAHWIVPPVVIQLSHLEYRNHMYTTRQSKA